MKPLMFKIHGLDCVEEVGILKREIGPLVGGEENLTFDVLNGRMGVLGAAVSPPTIIATVARTGMRAEVWQEETPASVAQTPRETRSTRTLLTVASGVFTAAGLLTHAVTAGSLLAALGSEGMGVAEGVPALARVLYGLGVLTGAWYVLPKAWYSLRTFRPDMNLLMTLAVVGAVGIGEWFEAATVAFLFAVSLALESWSVGRARRAVAALLELAPPTARVMREDGSLEERPASAVPVGATFVVKPGDRIALDGEVIRGQSAVNQAPITGESVPVAKAPGDVVYAGTINGDGALDVCSTRPSTDTTLARIIRMVGEAQSRRAPSEQWVERFARVYTPAILGLATVVLLVPPLLPGGAWEEWLYRALVLLVIGCPCALVISTPVSIVAALAAAARNGILIKGGMYVEAPAHLKAIAIDKTGTLTLGRPSVVEVVPMAEHNEEELLQIAATMEARSQHPLAQAIVEYSRAWGISSGQVDDYQALPGQGSQGRVGDQSYWVGSHRYMEARGQETPEVHTRLERLANAGRSVVVIGNDTHVCGLIALADSVRPEAKAALVRLRASGVSHVAMLTGDNRGTAQAIADLVGVDEVQAELLPADKVRAVEDLVARYQHVAMVGDGVNDAPAMARATLGIAMGAVGSDAAIEAADIALMSDDLVKLPWLVGHARRTLSVIRQNITFALAVKALFVILTFVGSASLWAAIAADMGASLLVIFNALRLLGVQSVAPAEGATAEGADACCQGPPS